MTNRPNADEYAPYYGEYIALVADGDIVSTLHGQLSDTLAIVQELPEEMGLHTYAPGKWTIKEMIGHVIDTERIMAYRALCIARGDHTPLPGFEQDDYVAHAAFNERTLADLMAEWELVRISTVALLRTLNDDHWRQRGTANDNPVSPLALAYIIAGHELHHRDMLRTRYLAS